MARKPTQTEKKRMKAFEKDVKEEKKLWSKIEKIHKDDEGLFASIKSLFQGRTSKKPKKKKK